MTRDTPRSNLIQQTTVIIYDTSSVPLWALLLLQLVSQPACVTEQR